MAPVLVDPVYHYRAERDLQVSLVWTQAVNLGLALLGGFLSSFLWLCLGSNENLACFFLGFFLTGFPFLLTWYNKAKLDIQLAFEIKVLRHLVGLAN